MTRPPAAAYSEPKAGIIGHEVSKPPWSKKLTWDRTPLGLETVPPRSAAHCAGRGEYGKTPGPQTLYEEPTLHREADATQPGVFIPSASVTYVDWPTHAREASSAGKYLHHSSDPAVTFG